MSTLAIHAHHAPKSRRQKNLFARLASAVLTLIDVFAEAQRQADEARHRYPYING